jgi:hypothetical protein
VAEIIADHRFECAAMSRELVVIAPLGSCGTLLTGGVCLPLSVYLLGVVESVVVVPKFDNKKMTRGCLGEAAYF